MTKLIPLALALSVSLAGSALAQTTTTTPNAIPSTAPPVTSPSSSNPAAMTLTDEQAKAWVSRIVYSSDARNIGEVAAVQRDPSGKVTELHADIGGFLGLGETRVRVMPNQFKLENDRIVLNLTSDQAKALPQIVK